MWGYRARDASRLLGLSEVQVRALARDGTVEARRGPRGEWRFSFQGLVLLRAAAELARKRIPAARVRRALRQLKGQLPAGRALAGVHISVDGKQVVVRVGGAAWQPESGQLRIDFDVRDVATRVAPLLRDGRGDGPAHGAEEFYQWGCDLEPGAPDQAMVAYRRALLLEPGHAGANLNLGRLLHERGDAGEAEPLYRRAIAAHGASGLAAFNLGVALEDLGRSEEALAAYGAALAADPSLANAHFNRARLLEARGSHAQALADLSAYRRLERAGERG
jgi:tetratricopeptide (TPR) repeat protein